MLDDSRGDAAFTDDDDDDDDGDDEDVADDEKTDGCLFRVQLNETI